MRKILSFVVLLTLLFTLVPAPVYAASNSSRRSAAQKVVLEGLQSVPTSGTDLTTTDTWLWQVTVGCGSTGRTITVSDKQSSPLTILNAVSIAANQTFVIAWPEAIKMIGGVNWSASGTGCVAEIYGTSR